MSEYFNFLPLAFVDGDQTQIAPKSRAQMREMQRVADLSNRNANIQAVADIGNAVDAMTASLVSLTDPSMLLNDGTFTSKALGMEYNGSTITEHEKSSNSSYVNINNAPPDIKDLYQTVFGVSNMYANSGIGIAKITAGTGSVLPITVNGISMYRQTRQFNYDSIPSHFTFSFFIKPLIGGAYIDNANNITANSGWSRVIIHKNNDHYGAQKHFGSIYLEHGGECLVACPAMTPGYLVPTDKKLLAGLPCVNPFGENP